MESLVFHHIVCPGLDLWFISLGLWTFDNSQGNGQGANRVATPVKLEDKGDKSTGSAYTIQEVGCSICPGQGKAGGGSDRLC